MTVVTVLAGGEVVAVVDGVHAPLHPVGESTGGVAGVVGACPAGVVPGPLTIGGTFGLFKGS